METGRILHYEIVRLLGRGGMGEVYEALDTRLGRRVALKFVSAELGADPDHARRFQREAQAAAALAHPNIATLHALEQDGPRLFTVSELLTGETLRARMHAGALPAAEALGVARAVAAGLAHAHHRGVAHRDIKPENLLFAGDGTIKITDFGLAQIAHASNLTRTGTTLGTAAYMAPESVRGESGPPADVFALGVVLYEMLSGALPFEGVNSLAMLYAIAQLPPVPLASRCPGLPDGVVALVDDALRKDPATRPDANTLCARLSDLTGVAPPPSEAGLPAVARPTSSAVDSRIVTQPVTGSAAPPVPGRRIGPLAIAAIALAGLAIAAFVLRSVSRPPAAAKGDAVLRSRALADDAARFLTLGRPDSAEARARAALALDPANASAGINLAQVLRLRGEPTRAAALLTGVANDARAPLGLRAVAWDALGDMAMADRVWPEAVRALERSFAIDSSERAYNQLGYALARDARAADALALVRRGLRVFPASAALHKNAALALMQLDSLSAARLEADRAIALQPGFGPALGLRARLRARAGDGRGAAADWRAFLDTHPDPADSAEVAAALATR